MLLKAKAAFTLCTVTAPPESVTAPLKAAPSSAVKVRPSSVIAPAKVLAVSPLPSVTSCRKVTVPAPLMPDAVASVSWNVVAPLDSKVSAAPVPSPMGVTPPTLPVNVVAAVPASTVKSWAPSTTLAKLIAPFALSSVSGALTETAPFRSIVAFCVVRFAPRSIPPVPPSTVRSMTPPAVPPVVVSMAALRKIEPSA